MAFILPCRSDEPGFEGRPHPEGGGLIMRKALLVVGMFTACCSPVFAGPNSNGALIVHTMIPSYYLCGGALHDDAWSTRVMCRGRYAEH